jgi:diacylglycerol kinase family enzyme
MYRARRVVIESHKPLVVEADGEIFYLETHHLKAKILHKKLRPVRLAFRLTPNSWDHQ